MEETSLEDFLGDDSPDPGRAEEASGDGSAERPAERVDPSSVEPAASTSIWTPDPQPCESCGEVVRRRWRVGDGAVCRDCTDWDGS